MELSFRVPSSVDRTALFGGAERNLKMIREGLGVSVAARDDEVSLRGESGGVRAARRVLEGLMGVVERGGVPTRQQVIDEIGVALRDPVGRGGRGGGGFEVSGNGVVDGGLMGGGGGRPWTGGLEVYAGGRAIEARSENQQYYLDCIRDHDLVFGIGPAGTGKTYLAVAAAVHLLRIGRVRKAILARPAVEAGEKLGFLPGDQYEKLNPYLRPLLDALHDMMDFSTINKFMSNDVVEIVPLAYMRGRTLNDAVIILDEAQNTTRGQMQMFLTRMGQRSKVIVTGDVTQIDLPEPGESGLVDAARRLRRTNGVAFVQLERADVVRHPLVQRVIDAYAAESAEVDAVHRALLNEEGVDGGGLDGEVDDG